MSIRTTVVATVNGTSQVAMIPSAARDLLLLSLVIRGPKTPVFNVWSPRLADPSSLQSATVNGDVNHGTFDPPLHIVRGDPIYCEWTNTATDPTIGYAVATFSEA